MSSWTHVKGMVEVEPLGCTQAEKRYILETVLNHLPCVSGSENDMKIYIIQKDGYNCSSSCDEFMQHSNKGNGTYGSFETQCTYFFLVEGNLRDRIFEETYKEFQKWLCRLAKRMPVIDVMVEVKGYNKAAMIRNKNNQYTNMLEAGSWYNKDSMNWCEYLMWEQAENSYLPDILVEKYKKEGKYR